MRRLVQHLRTLAAQGRASGPWRSGHAVCIVAGMTTKDLFSSASPNPNGYRDVAPLAVAACPPGVRLIDVRQPAEYTGELGHVPGAQLVPLATVLEAARAWEPSAPIVLICRSGGRSGIAAAQLVAAGFTQVMNMSGGMLAYRAEGLPAAT